MLPHNGDFHLIPIDVALNLEADRRIIAVIEWNVDLLPDMKHPYEHLKYSSENL